jgi:hypothetical protein
MATFRKAAKEGVLVVERSGIHRAHTLVAPLDPTLTPARYTTGIIIDKIIAYEILA